MGFKQFQYFVAVAEEMNVGKAALRLGVAQPALSQQIRQLETQLGILLFTREKRRMQLTQAGSLFLIEARLALQQAEHAVEVVRRSQKGDIGRVRIGYVDSAMYGAVTPAMLKSFKASHSGVELILHARSVMDQISAICEDTLDVGMVRGPLPILPKLLKCDLVERENLVLCLPVGHRLEHRAAIAPHELRDELFVTPIDPPGVGLAGQIAFIGQEAGFVPRVSQHAGMVTAMACLVASGFGIAILPASLIQLNLTHVVYRPLEKPAATQLYMISRADERDPAVHAFLQNALRHIDLQSAPVLRRA